MRIMEKCQECGYFAWLKPSGLCSRCEPNPPLKASLGEPQAVKTAWDDWSEEEQAKVVADLDLTTLRGQ